MKRLVIALGVLAILVSAAPVGAELCQTCKGRYYPGDLGKCVVCGKETGGGAFVLCKKCSAKLGQCEHCRAPLKGARPVLKSVGVDTKKSGVYALGKWKYEYNIGAAGTRNENRLGRLSYDGKPIAGKEYDRIWTQWGLMQHFAPDVSLSKHMVHGGWLLKRYRDGPLYWETGRLVPSPDAPANPPAPLEVDDSANGKKVSAVVWQRIIIRLDSNPRPWYWSIGKVEGKGETIVRVDNGKYVSRDRKDVKVPGRFVFTFLATRPGTANLTLKYRKASRKKMQTPVLKTFTLTVTVKPDPAVERAKKLKGQLNRFNLTLRYHGKQDQDKSFSSLTLVPRIIDDHLWPVVQVSKEQAGKIIDHLGSDGLLARSMNLTGIRLAKPPDGPTYTITVSAGGLTLYENLGWDLKMLKRLDGLRAALDGDAAKEMDKLLARMSGHRKEWEKAAASAKPPVKPIKDTRKPLAPDKSPLHVQLARVCGLSEEQKKELAGLVAERDKAMKDFYAGMVVEMTGIKTMVAEARASGDRDMEKAAFARMRSIQAGEGRIKRQWRAKFIAVLNPAQEVKWFQYQARWVIDKYRKVNLAADQITKIRTAYVKQMMGVDLTDAKALGEVSKKINDYITTKLLTDAQRKAMKPPPEPVVVPERGLER